VKFEVSAAYAMGVALPVLEAIRRGSNFSNIPAYIDDFIAGIFLLTAAIAVSRQKAHGPALLVAAWGVLAGGLYGSFFGQVQNVSNADISGLPNPAVVLVKGCLFLLAVVALVFSIRSASHREAPPNNPLDRSRP
jgi:hypothetical protein